MNALGLVFFALALFISAIPETGPEVVVIHVRWAPLTQWTCEPQEFKEHAWVCATRKRMEKVR